MNSKYNFFQYFGDSFTGKVVSKFAKLCNHDIL
jgi:hypothetical protein